LTLRSLIQSERWQPAWELLSSDFRKTVTVMPHPDRFASLGLPGQSHQLHQSIDNLDFPVLPLAG
jgi:hypothetical protein